MILEIKRLSVHYGAISAVREVDIILNDGEVVTILGANGAGKSSILRSLLGIVRSTGSIVFKDNDLASASVPERVQSGLSLVPEGRQILITMSVQENLQLGAHGRSDAEVARDIEAVFTRFPNLERQRHQSAAVLSGGEQQMLAIGRALLARPRLLMLDEPSLGLSPLLIKQVFALLRDLNSEGLAILLVEQNVTQALKIAHRAYVLELGSIVAQGTPDELRADERIRNAYLGQ